MCLIIDPAIKLMDQQSSKEKKLYYLILHIDNIILILLSE